MKTVQFKDLSSKFDDFNSVILVGVEFDNEATAAQEVNDFFHEIKLIPSNINVSDIYFIEGNVLGEEGRHDYVAYIENPSGNFLFNPMVRLKCIDMIKWISDFIPNYKDDYNH